MHHWKLPAGPPQLSGDVGDRKGVHGLGQGLRLQGCSGAWGLLSTSILAPGSGCYEPMMATEEPPRDVTWQKNNSENGF